VWLGFDTRALSSFLLEAQLEPISVGRLPRVAGGPADLQLAVGKKPLPR
jgi:hypothetical protein